MLNYSRQNPWGNILQEESLSGRRQAGKICSQYLLQPSEKGWWNDMRSVFLSCHIQFLPLCCAGKVLSTCKIPPLNTWMLIGCYGCKPRDWVWLRPVSKTCLLPSDLCGSLLSSASVVVACHCVSALGDQSRPSGAMASPHSTVTLQCRCCRCFPSPE